MSKSFIQTALTAIENGQKILLSAREAWCEISQNAVEKYPHDYQTTLDIQMEKVIGETILKYYPKHMLVGEEVFVNSPNNNYNWYIDPIDGTRNFIQGREDFAISLALYKNFKPILGVISIPLRNIKIIAQHHDLHVKINNQPLINSHKKELHKSLGGIPGDIYNEQNAEKLSRIINKLIYHIEGFRISGALGYDLAGVALGEIDFRLSLKAKSVDVAAGAFIIQKLGGIVTDINGNKWDPSQDSILASLSKDIHKQVLQILR